MWDLIVSVPDHCLSFYFAAKWIQVCLVERSWLKSKGKNRNVFKDNFRRVRKVFDREVLNGDIGSTKVKSSIA